MFSRFLPTEYVTSIYHIDLQHLWDTGMRGILTDLDNTLVEWGEPVAPVKLTAWLRRAVDLGFAVCILSNNRESRVREFAKPLGIPAIHQARKPYLTAYRRALELLQTRAEQTLMVGDQLFTDIWGGNRMGMHTILVRPIPGREHGGTRLIRSVEHFVLAGRMPKEQDEWFRI